MCTVSYIGDQWTGTAPKRYPDFFPVPVTVPAGVSEERFNQLREEVLELKELLKAAKKFDEATEQPDCETEDKVALLRKIAEFVGVDLDDVLVVEG